MKRALEDFGWNGWFEERFAPFAALGLRPARVAVEHRTRYELYTEQGPTLAVLAGKLRYTVGKRANLPAVGDWVAAAPRPEGEATIHGVLPRRSTFVRGAASQHGVPQIAAANIDTVFIVTSCNADFNQRRIERYVAVGYQSGANPVVVLNKADLAHDAHVFASQARAVAAGAPVVLTSAATGDGIEQLREYLTGHRTGALLGSSGVGKSTIINRLLGEERFGTAAIRDYDDKGRHTTTRRELVVLPGGGLLIDTPGMRELHVYEGEEGLLSAFGDVRALAADCAFADCSHGPEPRCAVTGAVAEGSLPAGRLDAYRKLLGEQEHDGRKADKHAEAASRKQTMVAQRALRSALKRKGRK